MTQAFNAHELAFRGGELLEQLRDTYVVVCGCGAVGSHLATALARAGARKLVLLDKDRVETSNLGTQVYAVVDVGAYKAVALSSYLFRAVGVGYETVAKELTAGNVRKYLRGAHLVVDCFDNIASRQLLQDQCRTDALPCLHVGLSDDGYAEIVWDQYYKVPRATGEAPCDYPLARSLVVLAATVAAEEVLAFCKPHGVLGRGWTVTLGDLAIRRL